MDRNIIILHFIYDEKYIDTCSLHNEPFPGLTMLMTVLYIYFAVYTFNFWQCLSYITHVEYLIIFSRISITILCKWHRTYISKHNSVKDRLQDIKRDIKAWKSRDQNWQSLRKKNPSKKTNNCTWIITQNN